MYFELRDKLTPIKIFSIVIIAIAGADGYILPLTENTILAILINIFIKTFIFFIGFFGIFGNGKTKRLRATLVSYHFSILEFIILFLL